MCLVPRWGLLAPPIALMIYYEALLFRLLNA